MAELMLSSSLQDQKHKCNLGMHLQNLISGVGLQSAAMKPKFLVTSFEGLLINQCDQEEGHYANMSYLQDPLMSTNSVSNTLYTSSYLILSATHIVILILQMRKLREAPPLMTVL